MLVRCIDAMGQLPEAINIGWPSKKITLGLIAVLAFEEFELGGCLHTLRQHRKTKRTAKSEHRTYDGGRLIVDIDRFQDERAASTTNVIPRSHLAA